MKHLLSGCLLFLLSLFYTVEAQAVQHRPINCRSLQGSATGEVGMNRFCGGPPPPPPPSKVSVPPTSASGIYKITWIAENNILKQLYESKNGGAYTLIASPFGSITSHQVTGRGNGSYRYRMKSCAFSEDVFVNLICSAYTYSHSISVTLPPSVPTFMSVPSTDKDGSFSIRWGAASGTVKRYELYESKSGSAYARVYSGSGLSKSLAGRGEGDYTYRVRACNALSCGGYRNGNTHLAVRITPSTPGTPIAPENSDGSSSVVISWHKPAGTVTHYNLQKRKGNGGWLTAATGITTTSKSLSGLSNGTWTFRLNACNTSSSCSGYSASDSTIVRIKPAVPTAANPTTTTDTNNVVVSWAAVSGATYYNVQKRKNAGGWTTAASSIASTSATISGFTDGSWDFRIRACNGYSWACSSYGIDGTSVVWRKIPSIPGSANPTTSQDTNDVTVTWSSVSSATYYNLQKRNYNGTWQNVTNTNGSIANITGTSRVVFGLTDGSWDYRIRACNSYSWACSNYGVDGTSVAWRKIPSVPAAVVVPANSNGNNRLTLNWFEPSGTVTHYNIQKKSASGYWVTAATSVVGTSKIINNLADGSWTFRINACNDSWACSGYSAASTTGLVRKSPATPIVPTTNSTQSTTGDYITSWSAAGGTATYYNLQERVNGVDSTIYSETGSGKSFSAKTDGDYQYRLQACNDFPWACSAYSGYSSQIQIRTIPTTPSLTNPTASTSSNGQFNASWTSVTAASYYQLDRSENGGTYYPLANNLTATEFSVVENTAGTYAYRVKACNQFSWACSGYSNTRSVTVVLAPDYARQGKVTVADSAYIAPVALTQQAVGAVQGKAGVSGGAASYSIPITLPPGRNGMQPNVSLNYSSRGGNGIVGVGWSLSAGGAISRCGKISAIDTVSTGVTYSADNDRLCLNGQRLILVKGLLYGSNSAQYRTEQDTFVRVTQYGNLNDPGTYFKVEYKNGSINFYGDTSNSRYSPVGVSKTLSWHLREQIDLASNTILYKYNNLGQGVFNLDRIVYTGTASTEGNREIVFNYENRTDVTLSYLAGGLSRATLRLASITTYYNSNQIRNYQLRYSYSQTTNRTILLGITECSQATGVQSCLKETTFNWNQGSVTYSAPETDPVVGELDIFNNLELADLDGDGLPEYIRSYDGIMAYFFGAPATTDIIKVDDNQTVISTINSPESYGFEGESVDLDLNGKTEKAKLIWSQSSPSNFKTLNASGITHSWLDGSVVKSQQILFTNTIKVAKYPTKPRPDVKFADMNGDGYPDLLLEEVVDQTRKLALYLHNGNANQIAFIFWGYITVLDTSNYYTGAYEPLIWENFQIQDINGDGIGDIVLSLKDELAIQETTSIILGQVSATGTLSYGIKNSAAAVGLPENTFHNYFTWMDVNGDGLVDYVSVEGTTNTYWAVRMNLGNGTFAPKISLGTPEGENSVGTQNWDGYATVKNYGWSGSIDRPIAFEIGYSRAQPTFGGAMVLDYNNDGKSDLLVATIPVDSFCFTRARPNQNSEVTICNDWLHRVDKAGNPYNQTVGDKSLNSDKDLRRFKWSLLTFNQQADGTFTTTVKPDIVEAPLPSASRASFKIKDVNNDGLVDFVIKYGKSHCINPQNYNWCGVGGLVGDELDIYSFNPAVPDGGKLMVMLNTTSQTIASNTTPTDTIYSLIDGLNNKTTWEYSPLSHAAGRVSSDIKFYQVPVADSGRYINGEPDSDNFYFGSSMSVVSDMFQSNAIGGENETKYSYREAIYNRKGRGFQGFRTIIVDNPNGIRAVTDFHQKFPLAGKIESARTCLIADNDETCSNNPLSKTEVLYQDKSTANNKVHWIVPTSSTSRIYALNNRTQLLSEKVTTINLNNTDNYGNILKSGTKINNGFSTVETTTENVYDPADETNWWINKLKNSTVTIKTLSGSPLRTAHAQLDPDKSIKTTYTWTTNRLPDVVTVDTLLGDTAISKQVDTDYNSYGLPIKVTTREPGATQSRYVTTTYSSDGYFVNTVTDQLGQTIITHTYPEHGQVKDVIDINGLMSSKQYDPFGRVEQINPPAGTGQPAYSRFAWCQGGCDGLIDSNIQYKVTTYQSGAPTSTVYKDKFNRVLVATTKDFSGNRVYAYTRYNALGQKTFESVPTDIQNDNKGIHYNNYDVLGRLTSKTTDEAQGNQLDVSYSYNGFTTSVTANNLTLSKTYSGTGQLIQTTDANGGITQYAYDAMGNPIVLQDANGNPILARYNALGQKEYVDDPNMGHKDFTYTPFGEVHTETDANGDVLTYQYDILGRLLKRSVNGTVETSLTFNNTSPTCKGTVQRETTGSDYEKIYSYDNYCRPISVTTNIGGNSYTMETQYDGIYGRVKGVIYPNNLTIASLYNARGYLTTVKNAKSNYIYRQITSADVRGQYTTALEANGVIDKSVNYDPVTGQMLQIDVATTLLGNQRHRIVYSYDNFGNLKTQDVDVTENNTIVHSSETYQYDNLQRLTQSSLNIANGADAGTSNINYAYDAVGNFTLKSDYINNYTYGNMAKTTNNAGPNAARFITKSNGLTTSYHYDNNGNMTSGDGKTLTYNAFNKPVSITRAGVTSTFSYGADLSRYRQVKTGLPEGTETTIYIGKAYEQMTKGSIITTKAYIGDIAVITETTGGPTPGNKIGFIHRDRLGSVVTVTDENGNVVDNKSYDPFGKPRKGNQKMIDALASPTLKNIIAQSNLINGTNYALYTNRGFTDHEHLDDAQLIHMNGRVYDYNLGRFLSVDPFIQAPGNSQSMNPYSYIMNNPLAGTDPSGYEACGDVGPGDSCNVGDIKAEDIENIQITKDGNAIVNTKDGKSFKIESVNGKNIEGSLKGVYSALTADIGSQSQISKSTGSQASEPQKLACNDCVPEGPSGDSFNGFGGIPMPLYIDSSGDANVNSIPTEQDFIKALNDEYLNLNSTLLQRAQTAIDAGDLQTAEDALDVFDALANVKSTYNPNHGPKRGRGRVEAETITAFTKKSQEIRQSGPATITYYKEAYQAYLYGSAALKSEGYTVNLKLGEHALKGIVGHEIGHLIPRLNVRINSKGKLEQRPDMERAVDDWLKRLYPGKY